MLFKFPLIACMQAQKYKDSGEKRASPSVKYITYIKIKI